jgi:TrmH family RNA methyltransferase
LKSLQNSTYRYIRSLRHKKYRDIHGQFIAEGSRLVHDLIGSGIEITQVYATMEWLRDFHVTGIAEITEVKPAEMERLTALSTPSPALAVANIPRHLFDASLLRNSLTLLLDDIRDPGNLGTIIRTADWFGISQVICSPASVDLYNPKTIQSTMGSVARVKVFYLELLDVIRSLTGKLPVYGTFLDGENLYSQKLPAEALLVIGNEAHGISASLVPYISRRLVIPYTGRADGSEAESLNAAVAAAIVIAEFRRQQHA